MKKLAVLVFPGFQTLDLFGPLEMLGSFPNDIQITIVGPTNEPVSSVHGQRLCVDSSIFEANEYEMLFIPGGDAALEVGQDLMMREWIAKTSSKAELVMTVCTGSILLAMTGQLDGRNATTNKLDFVGTVPLGPNVNWVKRARWVEDGKFFTSSGVSAGIDMALAVIAQLYGESVARELATGSEYEWHDDANWDPFAERAGLIQDE